MKTVTLEEFAVLAKNDEALKEKILKIAVLRGGSQTDEMTALAAEYGYELEKRPPLDMEELDDDDLEHVAGGVKYNDFCIFVHKIFGAEPDCDG